MPKETKFHGILAVGRTKADAINNYRLLAMSKGATVQVDSGRNIAFVTQASHADGLFNPMSGNMDLETDDSFLKQLEFKSNSSGSVEVNHLHCAQGCGAHIVSDSEELVKFCPNCTSASLSDCDSEGEGEDEDSDETAEFGEDETVDAESADDAEDEDVTDEEDVGDEDAGEEDTGEDEGSDEPEASGEEDAGDDSNEDIELPEYTDDDGDVSISRGLVIAASSLEEAKRLFRENAPQTSVSSDGGKVEVHYLVCSSEECGAHVLSTEEVAECPACLSPVAEPTVEPTVVVAPSVTASEEAKPAAQAEGAPEAKVEEPKAEEGTEEAAPAAPTTEGEAAPAKIEEPKVEASDDDSEESEDESEESEEGSEEAAPEGEEGSDEDEGNTLELSDDEGNVLGDDTEDLDAMEDVDEDSESAALDVSYSSNVAGQARWTAYFKGVPVALASKSSAGKNADIFDTPSFGHAVLATAKISGIRKALNELGFAPIKHKVSVSKSVRAMVDRQVAEARAALATEQTQYKERLSAALAAAAIGLNRGFFSDKKNPIKATLWNAMSSAGIRNPEALIDTAFKNHSDAYHKTLLELASDLVSKPVDVQESLSKAIQGMAYQEVSTSADESLEGRLETLGTSVSSASPAVQPETQPATAVARQHITAAVQSLGRRSR